MLLKAACKTGFHRAHRRLLKRNNGSTLVANISPLENSPQYIFQRILCKRTKLENPEENLKMRVIFQTHFYFRHRPFSLFQVLAILVASGLWVQLFTQMCLTWTWKCFKWTRRCFKSNQDGIGIVRRVYTLVIVVNTSVIFECAFHCLA